MEQRQGAHGKPPPCDTRDFISDYACTGRGFQWRFHNAPPRVDAFDSYYQELLSTARRNRSVLSIFDKTPAAYVYAYWNATLAGVSVNNFQRLSRDEAPPPGAIVIGHELPCTNCEVILGRGQFEVYRQK